VRRRGVVFKFFVVVEQQERFVIQKGLVVQEGFFRHDAVEAVLLKPAIVAVAVGLRGTLIVTVLDLGGTLVVAAANLGVAFVGPTDARGWEQAHTFVELSQPL